MGMAMSFGAVLLTAGTKGQRFALPNSRVMIHQPLLGGGGIAGQATDIKIEAVELVKTKQRLTEIMARHTGQSGAKILADMERNFYMSAEQAKEYGIIDEVISPRKLREMQQGAK
jgi:ATP-dependent Clp protease protease subunit